jgi:hypothetical protein
VRNVYVEYWCEMVGKSANYPWKGAKINVQTVKNGGKKKKGLFLDDGKEIVHFIPYIIYVLISIQRCG